MNTRWRGAIVAMLGCCLVHAFVALAGEDGKGRAWKLSFQGFGPVHVGMTVPQAERALKMKLAQETTEGEEPDACHYAESAEELPGVGFMVLDGKIVRIDVYSVEYQTVSGVRVGMSEAEVLSRYPGIKVERHHYEEAGHYLVLESDDHRRGMVFETDGQKVTRYRAGDREPVGYVEGCL